MTRRRRDDRTDAGRLDRRACDRARMARDARFDGRFFSGVLTTRIYCRPVCPVRPARSENVAFFPTAAAAEHAGFRPCLRCRPETAPGTPAWQGAATTVSRALDLINRGFLDERRVEDLADALGMGARHLTRLFVRYVGAPPTAAARTRRVQLGKALLDETRMPIAQIAFAAGFSSIRRFNAVFAETYRRSPSAIRRSPGDASVTGGPITVRLAYRPPFSWPHVAALLAAESTPGVEEVGPDGYRRTVTLDGKAGWLSVRPVPSEHQLTLAVWLPDYARLGTVVERVRVMFDLKADPRRIVRQLAAEPALVPLLRRAPGVRLPGAWDGFEVAVLRLVARELDPSRTMRAMARLAEIYGRCCAAPPRPGPTQLFPDAAALAEIDDTATGLSRHAVKAVRRLARTTAAGTIRFDATVSFDTLVSQLIGLGSFDAPTAHWIAMRTLAEPDAVPFGAEPGGGRSRRVSRHERWRPWRSYVAVLNALRSTGRAGRVSA